jgi:hypothetical protein
LAKIDLLEKRILYLEGRVSEPASLEKTRKKNRRKNDQLSKRFRVMLM